MTGSIFDPWSVGARLATRVIELNTDLGTLAVAKFDDSLQRCNLAICPQALKAVLSTSFFETLHWPKPTASSGDMRPSGTTAVASTQIAPTPRVAKPWGCIIMQK